MTHGKTYNKSPCRINHKATKSKTNTGTTALERSVEQTTGFENFENTLNFTILKIVFPKDVFSSILAIIKSVNSFP